MKTYNKIMDAIQEPLEWMSIGALMAVTLIVLF